MIADRVAERRAGREIEARASPTGNCSWCAIASGAVVRIISAKAASGTCVLDAPGTKLDSGCEFCALEDCSGWLGMFAGT